MNVQQYCEQLTALSERAKKAMAALERERGHANDTIQKAQGSFGDQSAGQALVATLFNANNALGAADSALYALRSRVESYIQQVRM